MGVGLASALGRWDDRGPDGAGVATGGGEIAPGWRWAADRRRATCRVRTEAGEQDAREGDAQQDHEGGLGGRAIRPHRQGRQGEPATFHDDRGRARHRP